VRVTLLRKDFSWHVENAKRRKKALACGQPERLAIVGVSADSWQAKVISAAGGSNENGT